MSGLHKTSSDLDMMGAVGKSSNRSPYARTVPKRDSTCKYFQQGQCNKGHLCQYQHPVSSENCMASTSSEVSPSLNPITSAPAVGPSISFSESWVNAAEFVPKAHNPSAKSYAQVCNPSGSISGSRVPEYMKLCPFAEAGGDCLKEACLFMHGDLCDMCGHAALHPHDSDQRKKHASECLRQHERDMELSFAVARSRDKTCGVCFEIIMDKSPREQRFGILPNCNHCFCLVCIRKWRQAKQFDNKIIRACPECRVTSDFVCPSMFWVDTKEEKEKLINDYKEALSLKDCKYFKKGVGKCPFGNKCFYMHAVSDGTKVDVGPPQRQTRRHNNDGELEVLQQMILWDFLEEHESHWMYSIDDLEDLVAFFSDSEDSDWSEYDLFFD